MSTVRVLVIHGGTTMRRVLTEVLSADPGLEVVGTAPDGATGAAQVPLIRPDAVLLEAKGDVVNTLTALRTAAPGVTVVLFSPAGGAGAAASLEALNHGADDYVMQPGGDSPGGPIQHLRDVVCPALRRAGAGSVAAGARDQLERLIDQLRGVSDPPGEAPASTRVSTRS